MNKFFIKGFEKTAITLKEINKFMPIIKKNLIRAKPKIDTYKGNFNFAKRDGGIYMGPITTSRPYKDEAKEIVNNLIGKGTPQGKIFAKGDTAKLIENITGKKLEPKNREMANKIMLMHEEMERQALKKGTKGLKNYKTHADPDIILRESNLISTLPKEYSKVKDIFGYARKMDTTASDLEKLIPGFQYGTKRYSRHARKRMNEILKKKGLIPMNEEEIIDISNHPFKVTSVEDLVGGRFKKPNKKGSFIDNIKNYISKNNEMVPLLVSAGLLTAGGLAAHTADILSKKDYKEKREKRNAI